MNPLLYPADIGVDDEEGTRMKRGRTATEQIVIKSCDGGEVVHIVDVDIILGQDRAEYVAIDLQKDLCVNNRPIHHHLAVMVEREAWMAREAWGFSMDVSDDTCSHVLALRTTVVEQRALISGLQAADHQRQVQLTMALKLLKGLQTQMAEFQRQQGPAEGPAQPDAPEEAGSCS
ncbi:hypothetical protein Tco_1068510 [Tanacetum coccineum]|uniref:Uncharacterized protein n=1 Tax=Tanacetum coccineum TaxID=301880 RepID=A0ABQ5HFY1_9ASTR